MHALLHTLEEPVRESTPLHLSLLKQSSQVFKIGQHQAYSAG